MNIEIEYKLNNTYCKFNNLMMGKKIGIIYDSNTLIFAEQLKNVLDSSIKYIDVYFETNDYIPTIENCNIGISLCENCDFILAIGSGSLNDTCKYIGTKLNIECGVLPTACSMDGYVSKGSALMIDGVKVTETVNTPSYVLIDLDILSNAPKDMTASGFGDIIGKFTCLTDWKLANIINGEKIDNDAFNLMENTRTKCVFLYDDLMHYKKEAIASLIDALITAGISMAMCGNSRPASGSEHHMSHYLEMDFVKRGERIPLHGFKVAIGTLISIELYNSLLNLPANVPHLNELKPLIKDLPNVEDIKKMLERIGCPTKFSSLGVLKETMEDMLFNAYKVRDRYTILTYYHDNDLMKYVKDMIMSKYF